MCIIIESVDVAICYGFIKSIGVATFGVAIFIYFYLAFFRDRGARDLSRYLCSKWHAWILRLCSLMLIKIGVATLVLLSFFIIIQLSLDIVFAIFSEGEDWSLILGGDYLPSELILCSVFVGGLLQLLLGAKGLLLPIGDGLAVSFDRDRLAFHIVENNPNISAYAPKVISAAARIRGLIPHKEIEIKSWLLVSKLPKDCPKVTRIRNIFSRAAGISGGKFRKSQNDNRQEISASEKHHDCQRPCFCLRILGSIFMVFYILYHARSISILSRLLPDAKPRKAANVLMEKIEEELGVDTVSVPPAPVSLLTFMSMAMKFPHIAQKFSGLDCGFIIAADCVKPVVSRRVH